MRDSVAILDIDCLTKTFENGHRALDGLSLSVHAGSIFGFLGLNGAGKTTTIRVLAGLTGKDGGTVRMFGNEIRRDDDSYKQHMGFVLDEPLYFEWMSTEEFLHFVGTMYDLSPDAIGHRTTELLEFLDLTDKREERIETLSSGMKKKISLAAAIIHKPRLIVLDEPLEGIDALASSSIKETLKLMAGGGMTIVITSHVLDTVEKLCDEVAIIHHGKTVLQCRTADIRRKAKKALGNETYASLEELFIDLVSDKVKKKHLSWM